MNLENKLRKEIVEKIKNFYKATKDQASFKPGVTPVNYAGRVYDEKELINLVNSSLDFWLTAGKYAKEFEERLAQFIGVKYSLLTNSGSSANLLAVSALTSPLLKERQLKTGDEVITTPFTFIASANSMPRRSALATWG